MVACFFVALLSPQVVASAGLDAFWLPEYGYFNVRSMMIMIKKKSTFDYIKAIRGNWVINPRTRVQDNKIKNKKRRRQEGKKMIKDGYE